MSTELAQGAGRCAWESMFVSAKITPGSRNGPLQDISAGLYDMHIATPFRGSCGPKRLLRWRHFWLDSACAVSRSTPRLAAQPLSERDCVEIRRSADASLRDRSLETQASRGTTMSLVEVGSAWPCLHRTRSDIGQSLARPCPSPPAI